MAWNCVSNNKAGQKISSGGQFKRRNTGLDHPCPDHSPDMAGTLETWVVQMLHSSGTIHPEPKVTREDLLLIHALCSKFEDNWQTDRHEPAEVIASNSTVKNRAALVESLVRSELEMRECKRTEQDLLEFLLRFPDDRNAVKRAFVPIDDLRQFDETTPTVISDAKMPTNLGPYEIIEQIARGGMGIIYRARHSQLDRIVALKVIVTGQLASEVEIARFRKESQTIASLSHPNIVPIYDVGESNGFQYFAMPLLVGDNLADRIRERPLPAMDAAKMALQIANAVSFAHQHGVIHRDLKPRNILLDASGNACVTDFGLAKVVSAKIDSSDSIDSNVPELTMSGEVVGTPAYMAPEQAAGNPNPSSDIYSIGAILYAILTGRPPFQAPTLLETLRQVQEKEPVEPRRLNGTIPRDMETIALKCLAKNPKYRYETASALANDLDRFLAGKPISARPSSKLEHAWRWIKRNPAVAGLSSAVVASLILGLGVSLWFSSLARNREELATQNFGYALSTVKKYLTDVATSPELKSKGLESLRRELLNTAQEFYEKLEKHSEASIAKERLADAHFNLGEINLELGQWQEADSYFQRSISGMEAQLEGSKTKIPLLLKVASTYRKQAESRRPSDFKAWEDSIQLALKAFRTVEAQSPSVNAKLGIVSTLAEFGNNLETSDRATEAVVAFEEVEAGCREILPQIQAELDTPSAKVLLRVFDFLGLHKQQHGKLAESEEWLLAAEQLAQSLLKLEPENQQIIHSLARTHKNLSMVYTKLSRFDHAETRFLLSSAIFQQLTHEHPLVVEYLDDNASLCMNRGVSLIQRGKPVEAIAAMQEAYGLQRELVTKQPEVFKNHWVMGLLCSNFGYILQQTGKLSESESKLTEAVDCFAIARRIDPNDTNLVFVSTTSQINLGNVYRDQGKFEESRTQFKSAVDSMTELVKNAPTVIGYRKNYATAYTNLATSHRTLQEYDLANRAIHLAKAMAEQLVAEQPDSSDYRLALANALTSECEILTDAGTLPEAKMSCEQAIRILEDLVQNGQSGKRFQMNLAHALADMARIQLQMNLYDEALVPNGQAIEYYSQEMQARASSPAHENRPIRERLCGAHRDRARALFKLNKIDEAKTECELGLGYNTGLQADSLRALYGRILSSLPDSDAALRAIREIAPAAKQEYQCYLDQAAVYANATQETPSVECLVALQKARDADPVRFQAAVNEPEFDRLRNKSEMLKFWKSVP